MAHIPSRMSSPELNLDHAPSAQRPAAATRQASRSPRRRPGLPVGRIAGLLVLLAAVAAGVWWFGHRDGACRMRFREASGADRSFTSSAIRVDDNRAAAVPMVAEGSVAPAEESGAEAAALLSDEAKVNAGSQAKQAFSLDNPIVRKAVVSYLAPDGDYLEQLLVTIEGSSHVREKFSGVASQTVFQYFPDANIVNADSSIVQGEDGAYYGRIRLYGGMVRMARTMGAVFAFGTPSREDDSDDDSDAGLVFVRELGARIRDRGWLFTKTDVVDFLTRYEVDFEGFTARARLSSAEIFADAVIKATLAHEFGHLAKGHFNGGDVNHVVSQIEEREADLFASTIAASDPHGAEFFLGQVFSMMVFAFSEKDGRLSDHPEARERVIDAIRANREWAAAAGITEEEVHEFFAENPPLPPSAPPPDEPGDEQAPPVTAATDGGDFYSLALPGGRKSLPSGSAAVARKELVAAGKSLVDDTSKSIYVVVPFPSVAASAVHGAIVASGTENLRSVSGGAWLVRATKAQYRDLLESGRFDAARSYEADDKGVPLAAPAGDGKGLVAGAAQSPVYVVSLFDGADETAVKKNLTGIGGCELLSKSDAVIRVRATEAAFRKVCALQDVESVTEWVEPTFDNDYAVDAMHVRQVWPSAVKEKNLLARGGVSSSGNSLGLTGKGQIVAVCDSGLDTGDMETLHPDVRGRVVKAFAYGRPSNTSTWVGDWSDHNGHGTHVVGSVLGNGAASDHNVKGVAFEAQLVIQSHHDAKGKLSGLDRRGYANILLDAYKVQNASGDSPRIHSDSWGGEGDGKYGTSSKAFDGFTFACPDFLTVVAASNDGVDHKAPFGVIDPGSISAPATAKNCLTVGAAESFRNSGGYSRRKWSIFTNEVGVADCPHEPIASDLISSSPSGKRGMAAFSSRGPCTDGRIKPDVVAPGTDILSMRSHAETNLPATWGPYNGDYHFSGGTSMSCPLVAGTAALVRQWLVEHRRIGNPDAATIKAVICAGAKSLAPGQYGTGETQEIPFTYPNNVEGWGMVDLENSVANPDGVAVWDGVVIGEKETRTFRVRAPGGKPLCILMAYSDAPSMIGNGGLVNDIDLSVTDPSGKVHYSGDRSLPDRVNNVEGVRWGSAPAGDYEVKVSVPQPPPPGRPSWKQDPRYRANGGIWKPMAREATDGRDYAIRFSLVANGAGKLEAKP